MTVIKCILPDLPAKLLSQFGIILLWDYYFRTQLTLTAVQKSIYSDENTILCEMLKAARIGCNLTQAQLAEAVDKPQSFIAKVEGGERRLVVVEFVKVVQAMGLIPSDFIKSYTEKIN